MQICLKLKSGCSCSRAASLSWDFNFPCLDDPTKCSNHIGYWELLGSPPSHGEPRALSTQTVFWSCCQRLQTLSLITTSPSASLPRYFKEIAIKLHSPALPLQNVRKQSFKVLTGNDEFSACAKDQIAHTAILPYTNCLGFFLVWIWILWEINKKIKSWNISSVWQ